MPYQQRINLRKYYEYEALVGPFVTQAIFRTAVAVSDATPAVTDPPREVPSVRGVAA